MNSFPLKHGLIFIGYFFFASLQLFNHSGGADIAFMLVMSFCFIIHFIVLIVKIISAQMADDELSGKRAQDTTLTLFALIAGIVFLIVINDKYLEFMWWLTHELK